MRRAGGEVRAAEIPYAMTIVPAKRAFAATTLKTNYQCGSKENFLEVVNLKTPAQAAEIDPEVNRRDG
jgi:hypothetical protein